MFKSFSIIVLAIFVQGALSQIVSDGQCPKIKKLESFDINDYMGLWYGIAYFPMQNADLNDRKCVYDNYTYVGNNKLRINGAGVFIDTGVQTFTSWEGEVKGIGEFAILYDKNQSLNETNNLVLGTDYNHYTVMYNCQNLNNTSYSTNVWIFAREPFLSDNYFETSKNILTAQNVDSSFLKYYGQENCPAITTL